MLLALCFIVSLTIPEALNREIRRSNHYHVATSDQINGRSSDDGLVNDHQTEDSYKIEKRDANGEDGNIYRYMTPRQEPHTVSYIDGTQGYGAIPLERVVGLPPLPMSLDPTKSKIRKTPSQGRGLGAYKEGSLEATLLQTG